MESQLTLYENEADKIIYRLVSESAKLELIHQIGANFNFFEILENTVFKKVHRLGVYHIVDKFACHIRLLQGVFC